MNGAGAGFGRVLLFVFGLLAPTAWGVLTYFELNEKASEAALALTVIGAATVLLLQWAWLSRMTALAERLERRLVRESPYSSPVPSPFPSPPKPAQPVPAAAPAARREAASHPVKGPGGGAQPSLPAALAPSPSREPARPNHPEGHRPESAPPALPPPPEPGRVASGGVIWASNAAPSPAGDSGRGGRRLEPAALAAAWNDLLIHGNGAFDAKGMAAALAAANVDAEIRPPDNFVGLGLPLLVALEPGQRERAFLLPDFTRPAKAFLQWFDLEPSPSARIERLSKAAELRRSGEGYELAARGRIE